MPSYSALFQDISYYVMPSYRALFQAMSCHQSLMSVFLMHEYTCLHLCYLSENITLFCARLLIFSCFPNLPSHFFSSLF